MSVREQVEDFVEDRPYIQHALSEDIVNYSALARKIEPEIEGGFEATKIALRRHQKELKTQRKKRKNKITEVLGETSIELKSGFKACKSEQRQKAYLNAKTENGWTNILKQSQACKGEEIEDQIVITLRSPENLEDTPGVMAYICSLLAARDINITELISCREDSHIIISEEDATEAFKLLNEKF